MKTLEDVNILLAMWKKLLRLEHWKFHTRWVYPNDMAGAVARIHLNPNHNEAWIDLVRPEHLDENNNDVHASLVHELIHIFTRPLTFYKGVARQEQEEVLCNRLSEALVFLARTPRD